MGKELSRLRSVKQRLYTAFNASSLEGLVKGSNRDKEGMESGYQVL